MKDADYYALDHEQWVAWMKGRVQLNRLFDARVFSIGPTDGGDIKFEENCDEWYFEVLTPQDLRALADELRAVADELAPDGQP